MVERIDEVHTENYGVYGVRKMWHALRLKGIDTRREHTACVMRFAGKDKGGSSITTRKPKGSELRPVLVDREFKAQEPNQLYLTDINYVRTR